MYGKNGSRRNNRPVLSENVAGQGNVPRLFLKYFMPKSALNAQWGDYTKVHFHATLCRVDPLDMRTKR